MGEKDEKKPLPDADDLSDEVKKKQHQKKGSTEERNHGWDQVRRSSKWSTSRKNKRRPKDAASNG